MEKLKLVEAEAKGSSNRIAELSEEIQKLRIELEKERDEKMDILTEKEQNEKHNKEVRFLKPIPRLQWPDKLVICFINIYRFKKS